MTVDKFIDTKVVPISAQKFTLAQHLNGNFLTRHNSILNSFTHRYINSFYSINVVLLYKLVTILNIF